VRAGLARRAELSSIPVPRVKTNQRDGVFRNGNVASRVLGPARNWHAVPLARRVSGFSSSDILGLCGHSSRGIPKLPFSRRRLSRNDTLTSRMVRSAPACSDVSHVPHKASARQVLSCFSESFGTPHGSVRSSFRHADTLAWLSPEAQLVPVSYWSWTTTSFVHAARSAYFPPLPNRKQRDSHSHTAAATDSTELALAVDAGTRVEVTLVRDEGDSATEGGSLWEEDGLCRSQAPISETGTSRAHGRRAMDGFNGLTSTRST